MKVKIIRECGYEESLLGLSLSFYDHSIPLVNWDYCYDSYDNFSLDRAKSSSDVEDIESFWNHEKFEKAQKIALHLAHKKGNNEIRNNDDYVRAEKKFLRQIHVWVYIQAPRSFWSEYDTYMIGMEKQSSSTMHTLSKRNVDIDDFEYGISDEVLNGFNKCIDCYNDKDSVFYHNVSRLKDNLPESWLQERVICTNYATLQNIINQREGHRLRYWKIHNDEILSQIEHPELLVCVK